VDHDCEPKQWIRLAELMAGGFEILEIGLISSSPCRSLHFLQVIYGADGDLDAEDLSFGSPSTQFFEDRHAVESLYYVHQAKLSLDRNPVSTCQLSGYGGSTAEQGFACMDVAMNRDGDRRDPLEVLGIGRDHDVQVLCSPYHAPGVDGEAADQDELDACLGESTEKLIESRLGQLRRAAPVNRISW
jgi:hypothetical protein